MSDQLDRRIRQVMQRVVDESPPPPEIPVPRPTTPIARPRIPNWVAALASAAVVLVVLGGTALLVDMDDARVGDAAVPTTTVGPVTTVAPAPVIVAVPPVWGMVRRWV